MIASVHVADVGITSAATMRLPKPEAVPGLRDSRGGFTGRLRDTVIPDAVPSRAAWIGFWDDDDALDRFLLGGDRIVDTFAGGWSVRMSPLRAHGSWPGLPDEVPTARTVEGSGPVVVLTLGLLRLRRSVPWLRASRLAQRRLESADGVIWAMGVSRPPFFAATISVWESADASTAFAYDTDGGHALAIEANRANPFMKQDVFARFRPYAASGSLGGTPSIEADWLTSRV